MPHTAPEPTLFSHTPLALRLAPLRGEVRVHLASGVCLGHLLLQEAEALWAPCAAECPHEALLPPLLAALLPLRAAALESGPLELRIWRSGPALERHTPLHPLQAMLERTKARTVRLPFEHGPQGLCALAPPQDAFEDAALSLLLDHETLLARQHPGRAWGALLHQDGALSVTLLWAERAGPAQG